MIYRDYPENPLDYYDLFDNNNPYVEFHENGNKRIEINFKDGLLHGSRRCWYESGQIEEQATYENDKLNGTYISWHENGIKDVDEIYFQGELDGTSTHWYKNGQKSAEINYSKGVKDGQLVLWHEDGSKKSEVIYSNGRMNSLWVSWYSNGRIQKSVLFKNQKKVTKTLWHSNGHLKLQEDYANSRRFLQELPEIDFSRDIYDYGIPWGHHGTPPKKLKYSVEMIRRKSWYENSNIEAEWTNYGYFLNLGWYKNGQLKYNYGFDGGISPPPSGNMNWHENGQLSYKNEPGTDKYISFDINGIKEYELESKLTFDDDDCWREKYIFFDKKGNKLCTVKREDDHSFCYWYFYDDNDNKVFGFKFDISFDNYVENSLRKDEIWQFWINQDIKELTKILTPVEKHKELLCNPILSSTYKDIDSIALQVF